MNKIRSIFFVIIGVAVHALFFTLDAYAAGLDGMRINEIMYYPPQQSLGKNLPFCSGDDVYGCP